MGRYILRALIEGTALVIAITAAAMFIGPYVGLVVPSSPAIVLLLTGIIYAVVRFMFLNNERGK